MKKHLLALFGLFFSLQNFAQDLSTGLVVNDMASHPMQALTKPAYLATVIDPSFGTIIRRITNAGAGKRIMPLYSTIQAWNADETYMIVFDADMNVHKLLNGINYQFIRDLSDVHPDDDEQIFWDFNDPDIFYFIDHATDILTRYHVSTATQDIVAGLRSFSVPVCDDILAGDDVNMMSWDSDVIGFRCGTNQGYSYKLSTATLTTFTFPVYNLAPMPGPSGTNFYHYGKIYNSSGNLTYILNVDNPAEHACIGKLTNGHDAYFAVAFEQGPGGGCQGDIVAHDMTTGTCFPITGPSLGYNYPKSGTHISSLAHKNTDGGWLAASMIGDNRGQFLLDQELIIAKADQGHVKVCRIGHHRSDRDDFGYYGEPHASISPSGTRVLFASDWNGSGQVDCYVVELPVFTHLPLVVTENNCVSTISMFPDPANKYITIDLGRQLNEVSIVLYNTNMQTAGKYRFSQKQNIRLNLDAITSGIYFVFIKDESNGEVFIRKLIVK